MNKDSYMKIIDTGLITVYSVSFNELMEVATWHAALQVEFDKELLTELTIK